MWWVKVRKSKNFRKQKLSLKKKKKKQGWLTAPLLPAVVAGLLHSCSTGRTAGLLHIEPVWSLPTAGGGTVINIISYQNIRICFVVLSMNTTKKRDIKAFFRRSQLPCPVCGCWLNIRRERESLRKRKRKKEKKHWWLNYRMYHCKGKQSGCSKHWHNNHTS